jgi:hypothetical protein
MMTSSSNETLERIARRVPVPESAYERLLLRRDRKRRNQRIAAGVVGIAVFVTTVSVVWGVGSQDRTGTSGVPGGAGTDPFISIQTQLATDETARDLFTVRGGSAGYWRMYALDQFDGVSFTSSDPLAVDRGTEVMSPVDLSQQAANDTPETRTRSYVFRMVRDVRSPWLPLPYGSQTLTLTKGKLTYDPFLNQAVVDGGLDEGFEYSVKATDVLPSAEDLDAASAQFLTPREYGVFTSLPDSIDPEIEQIAEQWTAGEPTAYRQVLALQRRFQSDFLYDSGVDLVEDEDTDALLSFITETREGMCQQFSMAMAAMARSLGIPARVAVGYQSGTETEDGKFLVQTKDAHAWVEVYFPGYGWLPFEPTPGRGLSPSTAAGTYLNPAVPTDGS